MADYYEINPFNRKVSFAVLPIDAYTGRPVAGKRADVFVRGAGQKPVIKDDGCHVFINLPPGLWHTEIKSEEYFQEMISVDTLDRPGAIVKVSLIPNSRYRLLKGATFIDCSCAPGTEIYAFPTGEGLFRLHRHMEGCITLRAASNLDLSGQLFAFWASGKPNIFKMGEKLGKNAYAAALKNCIESGAMIYPVSIGRSDESGRLLCPLRGFREGHSSVLICLGDTENSSCLEREIVYGKGNALKL